MLAVLLPKPWFWIENHDWHNCFWMSSLGLTLTGPIKASKSTILYNRFNKEKTPGRCCQAGYLLPWWLWCTIGGLGTLRKCYVSSPVAQTLVLDSKYIQTENTTHTHQKKTPFYLNDLEISWMCLTFCWAIWCSLDSELFMLKQPKLWPL